MTEATTILTRADKSFTLLLYYTGLIMNFQDTLAAEMRHELPSTIKLFEMIAVKGYPASGEEQSRRYTPKGMLSFKQRAKICNLVENFLGNDLSVEWMASEVCISPYHFSRLFRSTFGMTPYRYVLQMRIARAAYLLCTEPRRSISEIALETGFSTHAHLSDTFKRFIGVTPKSWRNATLQR